MVFNATFNTISVISWRLVLLVAETGVPGENHSIVTESIYIPGYINTHITVIIGDGSCTNYLP